MENQDDDFVDAFTTFPDSGFSTSSNKETALDWEMLEEMYEKVLGPRQPIKILVSDKLPEGSIFRAEYKHTIYFMINRTDLGREIDKLPMFPATGYSVPSGALGEFAGVPIYEDDKLVIEIFAHLIRKELMMRPPPGPVWFTGIT